MSANIDVGGLIGAVPLTMSGIWGVNELGISYGPFGGPSTYNGVVLGDSPVGFWPLDEVSGTVCNNLAGAYDLTYRNTPALNQLGPSIKIPRSVLFDGVNEVADGDDSATFTNSSSGNWSLECWINFTSASTSLTPFMVRSTAASGATVTGAIIVNNATAGVISAQAFNAAGSALIQLNSSTGFNNGEWHYVVATATSGGAFRLFVNNVEVASSSAARNTNSSQRSITVGANRIGVSSHVQFFPGNIACVAYYSTALSAGQIAAHYAAGTT